MNYYAGIDVSLGSSSLCVVDASGTIFREAKVASEPAALISWFLGLRVGLERIGLEVNEEKTTVFETVDAASFLGEGSGARL